MERIIAGLVSLLLVLAGVYIIFQENIPWATQDTNVGMVKEGNGLVGRFMEAMTFLYWNPSLFVTISFLAGLGTTGLVVYWKKISTQ